MSTPPTIANDGTLQNFATGAGTSADPVSQMRLLHGGSLAQQTIDTLVKQEWGCANHVRGLPTEATRKGFDLSRVRTPDSEDDDEDAARKIQDRLGEMKATASIREACVWARQYGGAILIAHTSDSGDVAEPMTLSDKTKIVRLEVRSKYQVEEPQSQDIEEDVASPHYGAPRVWRLRPLAGATGAPVVVHASRVFVWRGVRSRASDEAWGFGDSVLETFQPVWYRYTHSIHETLAVVPRLAETRWGIPGLNKLLAEATDEEKQGFRKYAGELAAVRSGLRIAFHDTDEKLTDASIQIQGAISLIDKTREDVSGAAGTSAQRFFGLQQQGLSNSDESGSERDDAATTAYQNEHVIPCLDWLTEIAAHDVGIPLESWSWSPRALREETPAQRAKRQLDEASRRTSDIDSGVVHENEVRAGLKKGDLEYEFQEQYDETRAEAIDPEFAGECPEPDAEPSESVGAANRPGVAEGVQSDLPNGAQLNSVVAVVEKYTQGSISRESALSFMVLMFGLPESDAKRLLGPESFRPRTAEPLPAPQERPGAEPENKVA